MKKKLLITTLTLTSLLLIGGCGQSKAVETTATVEETAEVTEAEVTPTPEPTVEPTPESTPTPVVELADDEVIPASLEAWDKAKHYLFNEVFSGEVYPEDEVRQAAYDRDANIVSEMHPSYKQFYSNGMLYVNNNGEERRYSLCDDGKYFDPVELFDDTVIKEEFSFENNYGRTSDAEGTNFVWGADNYHVAHDWTSDNMSPDDYYLIESYNNNIMEDGSDLVVAYSAYYINKATLLPEYFTTLMYVNYTDEETGESSTIVKDEDGNIIEYTGNPVTTVVGEFIYFDDEAAQSGDDYDTYVYMTTIPTDDQLLTGDDLAAFVTAYEEANPDLFTDAE